MHDQQVGDVRQDVFGADAGAVLASDTAKSLGYGRTGDKMVRTPSGEIVPPDTLIGELGIRQVEDIGIAVATVDRSGSLTNLAGDGATARFTWSTWEAEDIEWRARRRPLFDSMSDVFDEVGYDLGSGATPTPAAAAYLGSSEAARNSASWARPCSS